MIRFLEFVSEVFATYILAILTIFGIALLVYNPIVALLFIVLAIVSRIINPVDRLDVRIKYFDSEIPRLHKIDVGDWIDLRASETVYLKAGDVYPIRLGVGMILPKGYEAHVLPRSSTATVFGVMCANSMGVIDNSYSGDADEWHFPVVAIRDTVIKKGDRIAQFRIMKNQPRLRFKTVKFLNDISRGGIGSTGRR